MARGTARIRASRWYPDGVQVAATAALRRQRLQNPRPASRALVEAREIVLFVRRVDAVVIQRKADQQRVDADEPLEIRNDRDRAPASDQNRLFAPFLGERGARFGKLSQPPIQRDRGRAG